MCEKLLCFEGRGVKTGRTQKSGYCINFHSGMRVYIKVHLLGVVIFCGDIHNLPLTYFALTELTKAINCKHGDKYMCTFAKYFYVHISQYLYFT